MKIPLLFPILLFVFSVNGATEAQEYTPPGKGKGLVDCKCVAASSGCTSEIFRGNAEYSFTREISFSGGTVDLAEACWRYAERMEDPACCLKPAAADAKRFFSGTVSKFDPD